MKERDNKTISSLLASGLIEPSDIRIGDKFIRKTLVALSLLRNSNNDPPFPALTQTSQTEQVLIKLVNKAASGGLNDPERQRRVDLLAALGARDVIAHVIERTSPPDKHRRLPGWGRWK